MQQPKLQRLEGLVIFLNKLFNTPSIALKLIVYFVASGALFFGLALTIFLTSTDKFADLALKAVLNDMGYEISATLYKDDAGEFKFADKKIKLKWGFDALYSNLAFRLIDPRKNEIELSSMPLGTEGYIFNDIDKSIPEKFSRIDARSISLFRSKIHLDGQLYYFDVARSDLLASLANEAVTPAIMESVTIIIILSFLLFLIMSFIAIKFIVKPAKELSIQIESIRPDDLEKRLQTEGVPKELLPIVIAMNNALDRVEKSFSQQKRFIADAAHELRTPLTILLNRVELKMPSSEVKSALKNDTQYLSRIVEQLLDLSRAQRIKELPEYSTDVVSAAKDACELLAPMAIDKGQELELIVQDDECKVSIEKGELMVILKNLLENAIRHTPEKSSIRLTIAKTTFSVEDSGLGIPETNRELVFERFWRENQSDRNGSGLGLAIIQELLNHYEATISVSNSPSLGGAKFEVKFS